MILPKEAALYDCKGRPRKARRARLKSDCLYILKPQTSNLFLVYHLSSDGLRRLPLWYCVPSFRPQVVAQQTLILKALLLLFIKNAIFINEVAFIYKNACFYK